MSSPDDLRATRTRPFATTIAAASAPGSITGASGSAAGSSGYQPPKSVDTTALPSQGDVVGLHYRLVRALGEGNFGKVWVAERLDVPEHRVAMKILPKSMYAGRNVERELVMLATVGHPNVVQLKDHGIESEFIWLTMPVYEGETLGERLDRGPLTFREAYDIFLPIARAVEALHTLGLRHQDIKPENIFLARFGGRLHPVLLDLGVAAEKDSTFVAGTALYAAPEQLTAILGLDKETPLSEKMDTYCIGATLLLALVGDKLFPGSKALTRRQVIESHAVRSTKPLADDALLDVSENIRTELDKRLAKWMSLEPVDRPNMSQVAEELEILLEPEREAERAEENARNRQKRALARARVAASIVLLIGIGVGALALWKRETLRLAGELEEARAQGAENFEELDTCVAAHAVTSKEMKTCKTDLADEQTEHEKTLNALSKQGEGCSEAVDQMKDLRTKMQAEKKKHDDELKAQDKECTTEKDKLTTDLGGERDKFKTERDTCESSLKEKETEMTTLRQERDTCVASNGSGTNAGNTNASATSTSDPYADPPPSATVVPSAPPSGAPSTAPLPPPTTPPTTTPPPPPPPAPPPPAPAPTAGQTAPGSQSSDATPGSTPPSMQQPLTD